MPVKPDNLYRLLYQGMDLNKAPSSNFRKFLRETGLFLVDIIYNAVVIIILVVLIRSFLISPFRVVGSSMSDTLENKEFILIDKISYLLGDIDRGDPIVFLPPATSKDAPKFEELTRVKASGVGTFDFSELIKTKDADYCANRILEMFWFCKEKVRVGDLVYYAPQEDVPGSLVKQTDWERVKNLQVSKSDYSESIVTFE
ncbi:MAG: S26 family signal peptidase, partial [Patescibacteria group bacterium]